MSFVVCAFYIRRPLSHSLEIGKDEERLKKWQGGGIQWAEEKQNQMKTVHKRPYWRQAKWYNGHILFITFQKWMKVPHILIQKSNIQLFHSIILTVKCNLATMRWCLITFLMVFRATIFFDTHLFGRWLFNDTHKKATTTWKWN